MNSSYRFSNQSKNFSYRRSAFAKLAPVLATSLGFIAFTLLIPSNSHEKTEARIFTQGLSIQIDRTSPAYAALEDTLAADTQSITETVESVEAIAIARKPSAVLVSGVRSSQPVAIRIVRENRREESLLAQERAQRVFATQTLVQAVGTLPPIEHAVQKISAQDLAKFFAPLIKAPAPKSFAGQAHRWPTSATLASGGVAQRAVAANARGLVSDEKRNETIHQLIVSGPLQFTGGIAITSASDRVVVYREDDEERLEKGAVWLRDAKYEIFVDQPAGRLVGELQSSSGEILGRGYFDLATLPKIASNQPRVDKISMLIGPVPRGISGRVSTAAVASQTNPKAKVVPVANAHVQLGQLPYSTLSTRDGRFTEDTLIEGSTILAHTERPGHWGTMAFASVGSAVELPMFTDQAMRTLMMATTGSDHAGEQTSVVWGRVTRSGRSIAGAKVDLMTAASDDQKPVYFNAMMLPDPSLKETTANGLYAFFPIEPGSHAVQASDGHSVTEPNLFPTDEQTVTVANLELAVTQRAKLRVFDAFKTDWPLAAEITSSGRKHGALVSKTGEMNVSFTGGEGLLVLDADAGPSYDRVRVMAPKTQKKIDFPMVQSVWLERIRGALRLNPDPATGTVVGLIRGIDAYQVSLEEGSIGPNTKIIYFDAKGEVTRENYGERGGGFIIANMPPGFRTVLIQPSGSSKALATAVLVESRVTNVISKSF